MTYPFTIRPENAQVDDFHPTLASDAHSLKRQVRDRGGHRWLITLTYPVMKQSEWRDLSGYLGSLRGRFATDTIVVPGYDTPRGAVAGNPLANGAVLAGAESLPMDGFANTTMVFNRGDVIKFAGHAKVYEIGADVTSNGAGQATVPLNCPLLANVADNESIVYTAVPFTVGRDEDRHGIRIRGGYFGDAGKVVRLIERP